VGKSTLSVLTALGLAQHRGAHVTLVDMDLTGTSLADVLPLEAPSWEGVGEEQPLPLVRRPSGFLGLKESRGRMEDRDEHARNPPGPGQREASGPTGVSFLNDYLLFATPDWSEQQDMPIESVLWRMEGNTPESLRVIPSSALPVDLERIIPVVFDENHSGFLEGRLEYLLAALVPDEGVHTVVVDTPPTIPGLSRSVLSLALRLSRKEKTPLSVQGGMPPRLKEAPVEWTAFVVGSMDHQDVRAANRWLSLVKDEEREIIRFLVNRVPKGEAQQVRRELEKIVEGQGNQLLWEALAVEESLRGLQFFRSRDVPRFPQELLAFLGLEE
jgi:hypothetical protein